jgi:hypothetical protein
LKTRKKYINIFGYKIPTYNYIIVALDYGKMLSDKFIYTNTEKKEINEMKKYSNIGVFSIEFILYEKNMSDTYKRFIKNNIHAPRKVIDFLYPKMR